ncbi:MAG: hypothetical protein HZA74_13740 [Ignavibacteriales bacterium]|nr:hypothetical protein [Ignavibacteriales bacterium]
MMNSFWDNIIEQNKVKQELQKICKTRRVPHAFIFYGPDGVGKFNTAIQFIKSFLITDRNFDSNLLPRYEELNEPYLKLIFPLPRGKNESGDDSAIDKLPKNVIEEIQEKIKEKKKNPYLPLQIEDGNQIRINNIRDIRKFVNISSDEFYQFILILNAHLMNEQAQNALLKTLEEPPEKVIIILLTSNKDALLPTVQSRCRLINFEPLSIDSVAMILNKYFSIDKKTAKKVSNFTNGSIIQGLKLAQYDLDKMLNLIIDFLRNSFSKRYQAAIKSLTTFRNEFGEDQIIFFLELIKLWLLDAMRSRKNITKYSFDEFKDTFQKFNQKYPNANYTKAIYNLDKLQSYYQRNLNLNVFYLNIIFELVSVSKRL